MSLRKPNCGIMKETGHLLTFPQFGWTGQTPGPVAASRSDRTLFNHRTAIADPSIPAFRMAPHTRTGLLAGDLVLWLSGPSARPIPDPAAIARDRFTLPDCAMYRRRPKLAKPRRTCPCITLIYAKHYFFPSSQGAFRRLHPTPVNQGGSGHGTTRARFKKQGKCCVWRTGLSVYPEAPSVLRHP